MRAHRQHAGGGVGQDHAVAQTDENHEAEERIDRPQPGKRQHQRGRNADGRRNRPPQHHSVDPVSDRIAPRQEIADHVAKRWCAEKHPEFGRRQPVHHTADKRSTAQIGEKCARCEGGGQTVPPEAGRHQQLWVVGNLRPETGGFGGVGLADIGPHQPENRQAEPQKYPETGFPAKGFVQSAADGRADHRHHRHAHGDVADH